MKLLKFLLPEFDYPIDEVPKRETFERKKPIVATKLPKFRGSEETEKRIVATKLPKIRGKKKKPNKQNKRVVLKPSTLSLWWTPAPHF